MQTPKARNGSSEVPQETSHVTTRSARQLKISPESDSAFVTPASRTPRERSPEVITRSPRNPVTEVVKLHEDLKAAKYQLESSESCKNHALQEVEEAKKHITALTARLQESEYQFFSLSSLIEQLVQTAAASVNCAKDESRRLKIQLERTPDSEAYQTNLRAEATYAEIKSLKSDLEETHARVENLNSQLKDCKESEGQAQARVYSLEKHVCQLEVDLVNARHSNSGNPLGADEYTQEVGDGKVGETTKFQTGVNSMKFDVEHLGSALEAAELRYQEELFPTGNNREYLKRSVSLDSSTGKLCSPYSKPVYDDYSPKKKKQKLFEKIGCIFKKGEN